MQLADYLDPQFVIPELQSTNKQDVLYELLVPLSGSLSNFNLDKAHKILLERERLGSTGIGDGVAVPHGKMEELEKIILIVGRSVQGVDFEAIDKKPCHIFFLVFAPEDVAGLHLRILAHISRLLKDQEFRNNFMETNGHEGLWNLLKLV
ncbi:MAG TPA: PTS sugar transporter subunit IIA [Desulfohalobiaceae bacterium]|nr:PTS sugar transporter subunit IIA [Desulfohalobiaceae bacterium]